MLKELSLQAYSRDSLSLYCSHQHVNHMCNNIWSTEELNARHLLIAQSYNRDMIMKTNSSPLEGIEKKHWQKNFITIEELGRKILGKITF
jgi:hypothetical protein